MMYLDINECQTDNGGCTQTCDNTDGSYHCSCWDGYELTGDSHSCTGKKTSTHSGNFITLEKRLCLYLMPFHIWYQDNIVVSYKRLCHTHNSLVPNGFDYDTVD